MRVSIRTGVLTACLSLCSVCATAEEKAPAMSMESAAAKKRLMEPGMMDSVKRRMMGEKSMLPKMVAKEMLMEEMSRDAETRAMVKSNMMAPKDGEKTMMSDESVMMARKKMADDSNEIQMMFQELVARHIAGKKIAMMKSTDPKMATMAGMEMRKMASDKGAMMAASKELAAGEQSAMMMAREELIRSLMLDKEVMAMVEKAAAVHTDAQMAPMMSGEKMKMAGEKMAMDKMESRGMMKESMTRQMVDDKMRPKMKSDGKSTK